MKEFDVVLEECADLIASEESSLEECLSHYTEYAAELAPILITALRLKEKGRDILPAPALRARIHADLDQIMKTGPSKKSQSPFSFRI